METLTEAELQARSDALVDMMHAQNAYKRAVQNRDSAMRKYLDAFPELSVQTAAAVAYACQENDSAVVA